MLESHLVGGRQDAKPGASLTYGQSITDACLGWDDTGPGAGGAGESRPRPPGLSRGADAQGLGRASVPTSAFTAWSAAR